MSTEENSNDLKKAGGYLKEKLQIGLTRWNDDELERAILKVTSHKLKAPNEKHMARLLAATFGSYSSGKKEYEHPNKYIVEEIEKKTHVHNWIVLLKSLITLHKLMKEGSPEVNAEIQRNNNLFCMRHMKDVADSPDGMLQEGFIRQYTRYLEERSVAQTALKSIALGNTAGAASAGRRSTGFGDVDVGIVVRVEDTDELNATIANLSMEPRTMAIESLLLQLECAGQVDFKEAAVNNFATLEAYKLIAADARLLYVVLTKAILFVIDRFLDLPPTLKETWLRIYHRYSKVVSALKILFDAMNSSRTVVFEERYPELQELPSSILSELEALSKPGAVGVSPINDGAGATFTSAPAGGNVPPPGTRSVSQPAAGVARPATPPAPVVTEQHLQHKQQLDLFAEHPAPVTTAKPDFLSGVAPAQPTTGGAGGSARPLDDLFSFDTKPKPAAAAPPKAGVDLTDDLFGTAPAPKPVAAPAPAVGGPGFDPFAAMEAMPPPRQQQQAPAQVDFFAAPGTATAPKATPQTAAVHQPGLTADGKPRAW